MYYVVSVPQVILSLSWLVQIVDQKSSLSPPAAAASDYCVNVPYITEIFRWNPSEQWKWEQSEPCPFLQCLVWMFDYTSYIVPLFTIANDENVIVNNDLVLRRPRLHSRLIDLSLSNCCSKSGKPTSPSFHPTIHCPCWQLPSLHSELSVNFVVTCHSILC